MLIIVLLVLRRKMARRKRAARAKALVAEKKAADAAKATAAAEAAAAPRAAAPWAEAPRVEAPREAPRAEAPRAEARTNAEPEQPEGRPSTVGDTASWAAVDEAFAEMPKSQPRRPAPKRVSTGKPPAPRANGMSPDEVANATEPTEFFGRIQ
jgi:hypothetical protein